MKRGFTLVELLVVVGMIAVLGGAMVASVSNAQRRAKLSKAEIAARAKRAKKWSPRIKGGWLERYARFVGNASTGASLKG